MKSPDQLLQSLLSDISRLHPDVGRLDRDVQTVKQRFEHEGFGFFTVALPSLSDAILLGIETGRFACPQGFKKAKGSAIPAFLQGMLCKVFERDGRYIDGAQPDVIASLMQVTQLFAKFVVDSDHEDKLRDQAFNKFLNDDSCVKESYSETVSFRLRSIGRMVLQDLEYLFDPCELPCRNGPGAVSDVQLPNQKWYGIWDAMKTSSILSHFGYEPREIHENESSDFIIQGDFFNRDVYVSSSRGRLVAVPKNSRSMRTITVEPLVNQFVQQGLNTVLRTSIRKDPVLRQCLSLSDQSKNNELAMIGSRDGTYATLDLSSASDLLSQRLVDDIFWTKTEFLRALHISRTAELEVGEKVVHLRKYAGMGNATTFPVQSVVFSIICIEAILDSEGKELSYRNVRRAARRIRIFGDDIIVETAYAASVVHRLTDVGLKINVRKSFSNGHFRESCGTDFFKGEHVRPGYLRYRFGAGTDPSALGNLVCLANLLDRRFYKQAADLLRKYTEDYLGFCLPYVRMVSFEEKDHISDFTQPVALGWTHRKGYFQIERYDRDLQRPMVRAPVIIPVKRDDPVDSYPALLKFFHVPIEGRDPTSMLKSVWRFHTKWKRRWVAS